MYVNNFYSIVREDQKKKLMMATHRRLLVTQELRDVDFQPAMGDNDALNAFFSDDADAKRDEKVSSLPTFDTRFIDICTEYTYLSRMSF